MFDDCRISSPALAFCLKSANTALDNEFFTCKKYISTIFLTLTNFSFRTPIKSASKICQSIPFCKKRILLF